MTEEQTLPRNADGILIAHAWPGGYPVMYLDRDNSVLCPKCANENDESEDSIDTPLAGWFIHYEGAAEVCEECNMTTESAYGDPFEEESDNV